MRRDAPRQARAGRPPAAALRTRLLAALALPLLLAAAACGPRRAPAEAVAPERALEEYLMGSDLIAQERYAEALAPLRRSLELDSKSPRTFYSLALAHFQLGDLAAALEASDRALEIDPRYGDCRNLRGMIFSQRQEYLRAIEEYRKVLEDSNYLTPWVIYYNMGYALASSGSHEEALYYYNQALETKPDYPQARQQRAMMLERLGRGEEAIPDYEAVLLAYPESVEIHFSLGRLDYQAGRLREARKHFEWVIRSAPGTPYGAEAARYLARLPTDGS